MAAALDYKKTLRELYGPGTTPSILTVPPANYAAVRGRGDPNREDGAYKQAGGAFAVSYTIKTSRLGAEVPPGYFNYVVPPLEGLWWMEGGRAGVDYANKEGFCFISMIRLPEFATPRGYWKGPGRGRPPKRGWTPGRWSF